MNNILLYVITVLIWGTTWFAIKLQVLETSIELAAFYRAFLAFLILFTWCVLKRYRMLFTWRDHLSFACLGLTMFSLHHLCVYSATHYVVSGVVAVVFSSVSFLSILHNFIFFNVQPRWNLVVGALIGVLGVCCFFSKEIFALSFEGPSVYGLGLAGLGSIIFSFGSMVSKRNHQRDIPIVPALTFGMMYGALVLFMYALYQGAPLRPPSTVIFWSALLYLVIPGSIVGFFCYLKLIRSLGPERASFATVLFPVVALLISWMLENYQFTWWDLVGLCAVILGNVLVLKKT